MRITIQNSISSEVLVNGKLPKTSKLDKINHGLGIESINNTVSKNNGAIEFYEQDGWFVSDVLMPIDA